MAEFVNNMVVVDNNRQTSIFMIVTVLVPMV